MKQTVDTLTESVEEMIAIEFLIWIKANIIELLDRLNRVYSFCLVRTAGFCAVFANRVLIQSFLWKNCNLSKKKPQFIIKKLQCVRLFGFSWLVMHVEPFYLVKNDILRAASILVEFLDKKNKNFESKAKIQRESTIFNQREQLFHHYRVIAGKSYVLSILSLSACKRALIWSDMVTVKTTIKHDIWRLL